jgi:hypothetical protein
MSQELFEAQKQMTVEKKAKDFKFFNPEYRAVLDVNAGSKEVISSKNIHRSKELIID